MFVSVSVAELWPVTEGVTGLLGSVVGTVQTKLFQLPAVAAAPPGRRAREREGEREKHQKLTSN